jgi:hypothetical protein
MARGRILHVGSLSQSLGIYLPAKIVHKALGLARLLLFVYLLDKQQYALWMMSAMVFDVGSHVLCLGSNHSFTRYVAAGSGQRLRPLLRRGALAAGATTIVLTLLAAAAWPWLGRWVLLARSGREMTDGALATLTLSAIGAAALTAAWINLCAILYGLRMYLLLAALEGAFAAAFLPVAAVALWWRPTAVVGLGAYSLTLVAVMGLALAILPGALRRAGQDAPHDPPPDASVGLGRFFRYGGGALAGLLAVKVSMYTGLYLARASLAPSRAAVFGAMFTLATMVTFLGQASWSVIFTHAARLGRAGIALITPAYTAIAFGLLTLAVGVYVSGPIWIQILPGGYADGLALLGGLMTMSQVVVHLGLLWMLTRLQEHPWAHGLAMLAGAGAIWAVWTVSGLSGPVGLSRACGLGMCLGALAATLVYLVATGTRLGWRSRLLLAGPAILLLDPLWAFVAWAGFAVVLGWGLRHLWRRWAGLFRAIVPGLRR